MWVAPLAIGLVTLLIYKLLRPSKDYWSQYGILQIKTSSLLDKLGLCFGKKIFADFDEVAYQKLKAIGGKFCGVVELGKPFLLVKDLDLAKRILIKDFDHFTDRREFITGDKQRVVEKMLPNLEGEEWKGVRSALSPAFTTGKIRRMMGQFNSVSTGWVEHLQEQSERYAKDVPVAVNVQKEVVNFGVDALAASVFGLHAGTIRNPKSGFAKMVKVVSEISVVILIKFLIVANFPRLSNLLGISLLDVEGVKFFENILAQEMKERMEGKGNKEDFIQLIAEIRKGSLKSIGNDELSNFERDAQLARTGNGKKNYLEDKGMVNAQALIFLLAGGGATNTLIGFVLYMLALHPEVQDRLREEVDTKLFAKGTNGEGKHVDYDELNGLIYLDMVVCEVLRKYPVAPRMERRCVKEYYCPSENLRVPKGVIVSVAVQSIHNDQEYYAHPNQFYPEHFTPEEKAKRSPYAFMPFGSGPRNCIGMRFALVESKAAIAHLVHNFQIEPTAKTPIPVQVKKAVVFVQLPDDLELSFRSLTP